MWLEFRCEKQAEQEKRMSMHARNIVRIIRRHIFNLAVFSEHTSGDLMHLSATKRFSKLYFRKLKSNLDRYK